MNKQHLVLGFIALIAAAVGVWLQYEEAQAPLADNLLFTDLADNAAGIKQITISNNGGEVLRAQLQDGQWLAIMSDPSGSYPADETKLSGLVSALIQAKLSEAKTSKPENYQFLGVQSLQEQDSLATSVSVSGKDKNWQVLVGNQASNGLGNYVRLPEQAQSWLINQNIRLPLDKFDWLKQPILPFESAQISRISRVDMQTWEIEKVADGNGFALRDIPVERSLKYDSVLSGYVSSITELKFENISMPNETFWRTLESIAKFELRLETGESFSFELGKLKDKTYARFSAEDSQALWSDWYYQISSFSEQQLNKSLEDFLAKLPETADQNETNINTTDEGGSP
jgi:hypothetical protein